MRVNIDISNPKLYSILKSFKDITNAKRILDKHESLPSCNIYITDKKLDFFIDSDSISIKFDINNRFDPRWINLFPKSFQDINPYLRFALLNENIPSKSYNDFENTLINQQEAIIKSYQGFHLFVSEVREIKGKNLYEYRIDYSFHENTVLHSKRTFNQLEHSVDSQDRIIDNSSRNAYITFTDDSCISV